MRSFFVIMRNCVLIELEYRIYYLVLIFSNFVTLAMEYAILVQIFGERAQIGTLQREDVVPFIVMGMIVRAGVSLWTQVSESVETIRTGEFQKFLIQPVHYPSYFFARALGGKLFTFAVLTITVLVVKFWAFPDFLTLANLPQFLPAMIINCIVTWQLYLVMVYMGFWFDEASYMSTAFNISIGVFSGSLVPLDWIPRGLLDIIRYTPFPLVGDFPLRAGLGTLAEGEFGFYMMQGTAWVTSLALLSALLWQRGTRRYEAFGG